MTFAAVPPKGKTFRPCAESLSASQKCRSTFGPTRHNVRGSRTMLGGRLCVHTCNTLLLGEFWRHTTFAPLSFQTASNRSLTCYRPALSLPPNETRSWQNNPKTDAHDRSNDGTVSEIPYEKSRARVINCGWWAHHRPSNCL